MVEKNNFEVANATSENVNVVNTMYFPRKS